MSCVTLDRRDKLRHKVKTLLELDIDICKGILAIIAELHKPVVHRNEQSDNYKGNGDNDNYGHIFSLILIKKYNKKCCNKKIKLADW